MCLVIARRSYKAPHGFAVSPLAGGKQVWDMPPLIGGGRGRFSLLSNQLKRNNQSIDRTWLNQRNSQNRQYHIAWAEFRVFSHIIQWGLRNPSLNESNRKPRETNSQSSCNIHIWIYHICRVDLENLECNDQSIDRTWFSQRDKKDHVGHKFSPHIRVSQDWVERSDSNHSFTNCGSDPRQSNSKSSS